MRVFDFPPEYSAYVLRRMEQIAAEVRHDQYARAGGSPYIHIPNSDIVLRDADGTRFMVAVDVPVDFVLEVGILNSRP